MSKLENGKLGFLSFILIMNITSIFGQITRSSFSVSVLPCVSFSRSVSDNDNSISKKNPVSFTPLLTYSFISSKKNILDIGLRVYYTGIILKYIDTSLQFNSNYSYRSLTLSPSFCIYKPIFKKLYLGSGVLFSYVPESSIFSSSDTLAETTIFVKKGLKYSLFFGLKYAFLIKKRTLSVDFSLIKGVSTYFNVITKNKFTQYQNQYSNLGTSINFGLTYYFGANSKVDKVKQKMDKRLN